ncbi:MAG: helix-turn-helix domain-containing protein [Mogibacterium sp.]|nr:helix-turn-helix domain-containing protein [Mogibacterium sp.]
MNLTYNMIFDEFEQQLDCTVYGNNLEVAPFRSCTIYRKGLPLDPTSLYIVRNAPIAPIEGAESILFIIAEEAMNDVSRDILRGQSYIGFSEGIPQDRITNIIFEAFSRYSWWYENLNYELQKPGFLDNVLKVTFPFLGNTIFLVDAELRPVSAYDVNRGILSITKAGLDLKEPLVARARPYYLRSRGLREVFSGQLEDDYPRLLYNLYDSDKFVGIICIQEDGRPFRPSDRDILKLVGDYIAELFTHLGSKYMPIVGQLCKALSALFRQKNRDSHRGALEAYARSAGVREKETFRVIVLNSRQDETDSYLPFFLHSLSTRIPGMVITHPERNDGIMLLRCSYAESIGIDVWKTLTDYLGEFSFQAGISEQFTDLTAMPDYYKEARIALRLALEAGRDETLSSFSDYYTDYLINRINEDIPLEMLYSQSFRELMELDEGSSISYLETLRAYMVNHLSATRTANALYISRTALMYRLDKILSILEECGEDLNDKYDSLRIQISFLMYDSLGDYPQSRNRPD